MSVQSFNHKLLTLIQFMDDFNEATLDNIHLFAVRFHPVEVASLIKGSLLHVEDPLIFNELRKVLKEINLIQRDLQENLDGIAIQLHVLLYCFIESLVVLKQLVVVCTV